MHHTTDPRPVDLKNHRRVESGNRCGQGVLLALLLLVGTSGESRAGELAEPFESFPAALSQSGVDLQDRLELLNLIHFYSHLADGLYTDRFGEFFTKDAVFSVVPYGASVGAPAQILGKSRSAIVQSLRARHEAFRRDHIQRRHFLTNPIVWDQTDRSARVAVYLQLQSIAQGGPPSLVATGRYEGRAVKTLEGWRMAQWTIYSDQALP